MKANNIILKLLAVLFVVLLNAGCAAVGYWHTSDPRKLNAIAHDMYYERSRVTGARNMLKQAIKISEKKGDLWALTASYNDLAWTYAGLNRDPKLL
jgi:hypothetical protein